MPVSPQVVIARASGARTVPALLAKLHDPRWIYFGRDITQFYQTKKTLDGHAEMISAGALINRIALEIIPEFINFDQHLDLQDDDLLWQTTDLADKTPYTSDFFFHCCAFLAFNETLQSLQTDLIVIVEDHYLALAMARRARESGFRTRLTGGNKLPQSLQRLMHIASQFILAFAVRAYFISDFWRRKSILSRHPRSNGLKKGEAQKFDVVLVTWVDAKTFPAGAPLDHETFFGELPQFLRDQGLRVLYLTNPATWVSPMKEIVENIQGACEPTLLPEECMGLSEAVRIACRTLVHSFKIRTRFRITDVDVTELLRDHLRREKGRWHQCLATRYFQVGKFLAENGIETSVLIHSYENQPWEKALRRGFKEYLPKTKVIGYQHAPFAPLWLSYYPSQRDLHSGLRLDRLVVIGSRWKALLSELGYPNDLLQVGAALRFGHIRNGFDPAPADPQPNSSSIKTILMAASIGEDDFFELAYKTIEALRDMAGVRVLIKFHPKMRRNVMGLLRSIMDSLDLAELPETFSITEQSVSELLPSVDLVVHNGTSVAVEAMAQGTPTLLLQSDIWFDMDTLGFFPGVGAAARSPVEIRETVHQLLAETDANAETRSQQAAAIIEQAFAPIGESTVRCFYE